MKKLVHVLLISESHDTTANKLANAFYNSNLICTRININDFIQLKIINGRLEWLNRFSVVIFRRGNLNFYNSNKISKDFQNYSRFEHHSIQLYIESILATNTLKIGSFKSEYQNNKLINLKMIEKAGFLVPDYIVTNQKSDLISFMETYKKGVITKDLNKQINFVSNKNKYITAGTVEVSFDDLSELEETFFPSFFQKKIDSAYEIRGVFILNKTFNVALISDNKDIIDVRDRMNNVRFAPLNLAKALEEKMKTLSKLMDLNLFSYDFMVDKNGIFFLIDINPMGQFDLVMEYSNHSIGDHLIDQINVFNKGLNVT
ncbi:hypothetical protein F0365_02240 [Nonlabens sp. Ci31]|uniref:hypothetical protein n=1 Tax=Nonlabens sp. Ci31 TaxID=2608253 RepID=UPI0014645DC0|nr:hypothetical protein [Nonlabens sp. Ci31]QJP33308.1 hypothetical protein F0365_02240 [Nonlabens sp. Ci31]